MTKFPAMKDGQTYSIDLTKEYLRYACCDCGMVHSIEFAIKGDTLFFKFTQDSRATAQLRWNHVGSLHNGTGKWNITRTLTKNPRNLKHVLKNIH